MNKERIDTVVIGGGQAGLAAGYYLAKQKRDFMILDAHDRIGDSWRRRWDSLRLFTPTRFNHLPGMAFPARWDYFPSKDEMADYLEAYATRFKLPVLLGVRVDELTRTGARRTGARYLVRAGAQRLEANHVVVATGAYATPRIPGLASELDPAITQFHSVAYRNPNQLREGPVLVVGAGNSGAEIARELAATHSTWLAGRDTGSLPGNYGSFVYRAGGVVFLTLAMLLTADTLLGRWLAQRARSFTGGHPLIRVRPKDLLAAGVERVPRAVGVSGGRPVLEDGRVLDIANVVWSTGFIRDYRWIKLPAFDAHGDPIHNRGVVQAEPGLYFTGLPFQFSLLSGHVTGAGADAKYIAGQLARAAGAAYEGKLTGKQPQSYRGL